MGFALINFSFASDANFSDEEWDNDEAVVPQQTVEFPSEMYFQNERDDSVTVKISKGDLLIKKISLSAKTTSFHKVPEGTYEGLTLTLISNDTKQTFPATKGVLSLIVKEKGVSLGVLPLEVK